MSSLLISILGASGDPESSAASSARYRLPGTERIVQGIPLGIELATALKVQSLYLVGAPHASFDSLVSLLPESEQNAQVPEKERRKAKPSPASDDHEDSNAAADQTSQSSDAENPGADEAAAPGEALSEPAEQTESAAENAANTSAAAEAPEPQAATASSQDQVASEEQPSAESATEDGGDSAASVAEPNAEVASEVANAGETKAPQVPKKTHEPDTRSLAERVKAQAKSGRADRDAMDALAAAIAKTTGIKHVRCALISDPTDSRGFQASVRSLVELPKPGSKVHIDVTSNGRGFSMLATLVLHYLDQFRSDIKTGSVFDATMSNSAADGVAQVTPLDGPREMLDWMAAFAAVRDGGTSQQVQKHFNADRRLQRLSGPYVRYQRGVQFGAMSEVLEGARLLEERRRKLNRLPYAHPYRLFDKVLKGTLMPFLSEGKTSERQLFLSHQALQNGVMPQAGLHLRESLLSACLEHYGRDPSQSWMDVPQSGGAQQVRPRDVAAYILSTPPAQAKAQDLTVVWPLLVTARNRYVNTSPTSIPASQLKDEDHEIRRALEMTAQIITKNLLEGISEDLAFDTAVKQAIDLRAVRAREGRKLRGRRKGGRQEGGGGRRRAQGGGEGGQRAQGSGDASGGRSGGGEGRDQRPRRPRRDRKDRGERPGGRDQREPFRDGGRRPDPADSTPRVTNAGGGLGNLGLALAQAGLAEPPGERKGRGKGKSRGQSGKSSEAQSAAASTPPEAAPPRAAAAPPAVESPPVAEPKAPTEAGEAQGGFDVAGPGSAPPPPAPTPSSGE